MEKGFPADAHDAGSVALQCKKVFQLMLMMLGSWRWSGKRFRLVVVDWKRVFQLMLMMLGSWRMIGEKGFQLMLMMLRSLRWRGKRVSS